ncbi:saccharopine dehydrogenase NADP-binding domain-containing protein [Kibdelosporangium philippinense]|uniref:Saccharopine dehydrogenase NADP-binding domain-containing protein n=1 Tax=Kibdelosporangium philippinense TaxID=211113 RepID=A0ABS8ZJH5_9PSEU|nr:saccharopine dehydrogenase NADP-binding domain-containing protein [Kibdelosporangium philippinense]MCE7007288.1 saccharopine dehydrogenase NADP-binding domain-containing protein [Kibdelosporangium philippinense]
MIGVLGASGSVGRHVVELLRDAGELRVGGRTLDTLPPAHERVQVDIDDPASLKEFCAGLSIVVNCAGPSYAVKDRVANAALAVGADYVDLGGDAPAHEALTASGAVTPGRTVVLSAGTVPGLSVLLPRHLLDQVPDATGLTAYVGGLEHCSPTAATDILLSLTVGGANGEPFGYPLAALRHGRRELRALRASEDAEAAFFPGRVALQPILTAELERFAGRHRVPELDWYNVFPGSQARKVFSRLPALSLREGAERDDIRDQMVRAARIDLAGHNPYYRMVFVLTGRSGAVTAVLRAENSYRITAFVAASAARAILDRRVPEGLHFAGETIDPRTIVDGLVSGAIAEITLHDGDLRTDTFEDGAL